MAVTLTRRQAMSGVTISRACLSKAAEAASHGQAYGTSETALSVETEGRLP